MVDLNAAERRALRLATILVLLGAAARLGLGPDEATYAWRPAGGSEGGRGAAPAGPASGRSTADRAGDSSRSTPAGRDDPLPDVRAAVAHHLARARRAARPLAAGERLDPNATDEVELQRLPGVGPATARAIVEDRATAGPFRRPADLERVSGIGPATARRITPHLRFPARPAGVERAGVGSGREVRPARDRVNVNRADASELERLRGIGPALAARIVALRARKGRFTRLEDLLEVRGIGPATLEEIRPHAVLR